MHCKVLKWESSTHKLCYTAIFIRTTSRNGCWMQRREEKYIGIMKNKKVPSGGLKVAVQSWTEISFWFWNNLSTHCCFDMLTMKSSIDLLHGKRRSFSWYFSFLNIKTYSLCKNSMWPTKADIIHLKPIYNLYSQTERGEKLQSWYYI